MTHTADNTDRQENAAMRPHPDATPLRQPDWMIQPPTAATEHPVRCAARLSLFSFATAAEGGQQAHTHECIHPAKVPDGVVGVLEHKCHCGATWTERTERTTHRFLVDARGNCETCGAGRYDSVHVGRPSSSVGGTTTSSGEQA